MMPKRKQSMALIAAAGLFGSMAAIGVANAQSAVSKVENGKHLYYVQGCYACHGYTGQTGPGAKLAGSRSPNLATVSNFITFLRERANFAPTTPSEQMPNYSEKSLSDADAKAIYAYIRTFKVDTPKIADVPVFQKILKSAQRTNSYEPPKE